MTEPTFVISPQVSGADRQSAAIPRAFAAGEVVVARVEADEEGENAVLRIGSARFNVPDDVRLERGRLVLLRVVGGGPNPTMEIIDGEPAGGDHPAQPPGVLERLGLPQTNANLAAARALAAAGAPLTRDNIQMVTYAARASGVPEEAGARAAAFLVRLGIPPDPPIVRAFVAALAESPRVGTDDTSTMLARMLSVGRQLSVDMPEVYQAVVELLDAVAVDVAAPDLADVLHPAASTQVFERLDARIQAAVGRLLAADPAVALADAVISEVGSAIPRAHAGGDVEAAIERIAIALVTGEEFSAGEIAAHFGDIGGAGALAAAGAASELFQVAVGHWADPDYPIAPAAAEAARSFETVLRSVARSSEALAAILDAIDQGRPLTSVERALLASVARMAEGDLEGVSGDALQAIANELHTELVATLSRLAAEDYPLWTVLSGLREGASERAAVLSHLARISGRLGINVGDAAGAPGLSALLASSGLQAVGARLAQIREVVEGVDLSRLLPEATGRLAKLLEAVRARLQPVLASLRELARAPEPAAGAVPAERASRLLRVLANIMDERVLFEAVARADEAEARQALARIISRATQNELMVLREALTRREEAMIQRMPDVANLRSLYDDFLAVRDRTALFKALSAATETNPVQTLVAEFVLRMAGQLAPARLKVKMRRRGKKRKGPLRFVLDVSMANLGEVWAEAQVEKPLASIDFELERDEIANVFESHKDELVERLVACGYNPAVSIRLAERTGRGFFDDVNMAPGSISGLDVEA